MKLKSVALLLVALMLLAQAVLAKGPPQKVTISGGDLAEEIEILGDDTALTALAMMTLEDYETRTDEAPDVEGEGYRIARFFETTAGYYTPFDEIRYFPDREGGRGYINYIGIVNGSSEYDGEWFRANLEGETVLQAVITGAQDEQVSMRSSIVDRFTRLIAHYMAGQ
jgi:hypothetical protein